ncbi:MAG: metal-dependent transcriptional regulator [Nitrospirae bacterium]|jgi:DtxR family Mn-dependent transcriptional regulator|nr:metal-dependent transcriptional regulator [Nitrospirota bacterium]
MDKERIDEAIELLWVLNEEGHDGLNRFRLSSEDDEIDRLIQILKAEGLVNISDDKIQFTEKGYKMAKALIRRLRLAERLFTDVFEMRGDSVINDACKMEHILSEELTDSVCTFLGHPQTCPHGKPIPRGECCKKYKIDVEPVVTRLSEFEVGSRGKITFIVPTNASRLSKLNSLGITAGSVIKLIQRKPSYVIQVDETTVAIDSDIAKEIYVKKTA